MINQKQNQSNSFEQLIEGYKNFYSEYSSEDGKLFNLYKDLSLNGQFPKALFVACSDSRIDPAIVTKAQSGDIFSVRNVANLVPPYQEDRSTYHGTSSAIEFGINNLGIKNVVVMGHSYCAGVRATVDQAAKEIKEGKVSDSTKFSFVLSWIKIASKKVEELLSKDMGSYDHNPVEFSNFCAMELVKSSLANLESFPFVKEKVANGELKLHGWYFDISNCKILSYNKKLNTYIPL